MAVELMRKTWDKISNSQFGDQVVKQLHFSARNFSASWVRQKNERQKNRASISLMPKLKIAGTRCHLVPPGFRV
jgi:hypothetical protein